jgi:hypothetical protein
VYFQQITAIFTPTVIVPPELKPINDYIGSCLDSIAREGIILLGANGGFIKFPDEIATDPFASLPYSPIFNDIRTPLWYYSGQARVPSEEYVKDQLAYYIEQNLDQCLDNLSAFREQFQIKELAQRNINIELKDYGVDVILDYPLEITTGAQGQSTKINEFRSTVPLRLKTAYELAKKVMEEEIDDKFVEMTTLDLIAMHKNIPYTDMEFTCAPKIWYISDIQALLKRLLRVNLPMIRINRTSYAPVPEDQPYVANHYIWAVTELEYPTTHVSLSYDEKWPMQLYIRPNEGFYLKSDANKGFDLMSFLCMHLWHFTYDIKYPVLATITDDAGKNHDRYVFNFAFESSIKSNNPDKTNFGAAVFDFTQKARSEEFCSQAPTNLLTVITHENISTDEAGDLIDDISDVNLTYTCIRLKCPIGKSEVSFRGAISLLEKEVPSCVNGVLRGTKEGYDEASTFVSTDTSQTADLYLTPVVNKDITVVKHHSAGETIRPEEEPIGNEQTAIITVKRKNFKSIVMHPSTETDVLSQLKLLGKWDYTYELEIYLADDRTVLGGYKGNWTVSWNELKGAKEIKFHVIEFPYTEDVETQFGYISKLEGMSKSLPPPELQ